jgi:hypothetical protein
MDERMCGERKKRKNARRNGRNQKVFEMRRIKSESLRAATTICKEFIIAQIAHNAFS